MVMFAITARLVYTTVRPPRLEARYPAADALRADSIAVTPPPAAYRDESFIVSISDQSVTAGKRAGTPAA